MAEGNSQQICDEMVPVSSNPLLLDQARTMNWLFAILTYFFGRFSAVEQPDLSTSIRKTALGAQEFLPLHARGATSCRGGWMTRFATWFSSVKQCYVEQFYVEQCSAGLYSVERRCAERRSFEILRLCRLLGPAPQVLVPARMASQCFARWHDASIGGMVP